MKWLRKALWDEMRYGYGFWFTVVIVTILGAGLVLCMYYNPNMPAEPAARKAST